jgi:hypothetical protein
VSSHLAQKFATATVQRALGVIIVITLTASCTSGEPWKGVSPERAVSICQETAASMSRQGYDSRRSYRECMDSYRGAVMEGRN